MLKVGSIRFRAKCARHPRYNPALDGLAGIKGGCPKCHLLLEIFESHRKLVSLMRQAIPIRDPFPGTPPSNSKSQLSLF